MSRAEQARGDSSDEEWTSHEGIRQVNKNLLLMLGGIVLMRISRETPIDQNEFSRLAVLGLGATSFIYGTASSIENSVTHVREGLKVRRESQQDT
jgi:hypothetical protein